MAGLVEFRGMRDFRRELNAKMKEYNVDPSFARRYLNDGFSGGEKKRTEVLQMAMIEPKFAILDESDSGLDIDALRVVSDRLRAAVGLGADELAFGAEVAGSPVGVTEESRLRAAVDDLLEARQDVERNMNADGILDRCFLALGRLAPPREPARAQGRNR